MSHEYLRSLRLLLSSNASRPTVALRSNANGVGRDLRLDFFRGLALIFIFIDHVPGNSLSYLTMHSFGLSDAAEAFVLIAGFAAMLAYSGHFERHGMLVGMRQIGRRLRELYAAQILLTAVCAGILAVAARYFENPLYFEHVNLTPFSFDPLGAIWRSLLLYYQLGYINILPLYIVLLAAFPGLWWLLNRAPKLALSLSVLVWLAASTVGLNLPSWPEIYGWYFNPFAWQLLFTIGAFAALKYRQGASLYRSPWLIGAATAYLLFSFLVAAPWLAIPGWHPPRLIPLEWLGTMSKSSLSAWRLAHILAVAYLIAALVPRGSSWLGTRVSGWVIHCGRNGLDIFCLGTVLSFLGFIVMLEAGRTWQYQLLVNGIGVGVMICAALLLSHRKASRQQSAPVAIPQSTEPVDVVRTGAPR
ncbi:MAG: OpgC family protein [Hyphomicrobiaceae bacterium]